MIRISKKAAVLFFVYALSVILVLGGFLYINAGERAALRRSVAIGYDNAFSELATAVSELDTSLKKALCASSPSMVSTVCAESYAHCAAACQAIASLPYGNIELEHTAAFLAKTGDYLFFLSRSGARGESLGEEERSGLHKLSESAALVSETLSDLSAQLIAGQVSVEELERAESTIASAEDNLVDTGFAASFKEMETEFPEMPSLIYDGPFSEHIEKAEPLLLSGLPEVGEEEALAAAAKFLGADESELTVQYEREDSVPVYVVTRNVGRDVQTVEVSRVGGKVVYFGTSREPEMGSVSGEDAVKSAERFLEAHGFENMRSTYWASDGGEVVVNFAYEEGDVICYPDLVKVSVATDTGMISAFEAHGYTMCHTARELPAPEVDAETAAAALSPELKVKKHRVAVIPTSGKNEVLCHEFLCEDGEGNHSLIYVNAATGVEEKILLLLESENGTLTI